MDPITAINQEFARLVEEDWTHEAAPRRREARTTSHRSEWIARLCALIGAAVVTLGMRLQGQRSEQASGQAPVGR